jgi:hypothetical protein
MTINEATMFIVANNERTGDFMTFLARIQGCEIKETSSGTVGEKKLTKQDLLRHGLMLSNAPSFKRK